MSYEIRDRIYKKGIVYIIVNKYTRDLYIGSTVRTLNERWYSGGFSHQSCINNPDIHNRLYDSIREFGVEGFDYYEIDSLEYCRQYDIQVLEDYYIKQFIQTYGRYKVLNMMDNAFGSSDGSQMRTIKAHSKAMRTISDKYGGYKNVLCSDDSVRRRTKTCKDNKVGIFRDDNYKSKSHVYLVKGKVFYGLTDLTKGLQDMGYDLSYGVVHHLACSGYASKRTLKKYPDILSLIQKIDKSEWKDMEEYKI